MDERELEPAPQREAVQPVLFEQNVWQEAVHQDQAEEDEEANDAIGHMDLEGEHADEPAEDGEEAPAEQEHVPAPEGGRRRRRRPELELILPRGYSLIDKEDTSDLTAAAQAPFHQRPNPVNFDHVPTPLEVFELFFTPELINGIVTATNAYAAGREHDNGPRERRWRPVTSEDIYDFLSCIIVMGINHQPSLNDYWRQSYGFENRTIAQTMSYRRFRQVGDLPCCPLDEKSSDGVVAVGLIRAPTSQCLVVSVFSRSSLTSTWSLRSRNETTSPTVKSITFREAKSSRFRDSLTH